MAPAEIRADLVRLIEQNPNYPDVLRRALELEQTFAGAFDESGRESWLGFESTDIPTYPARLAALVAEGVLRIGFRSRKYTHYRLNVEPAVLRSALEAAERPAPLEAVEEAIPQDLFSVISGHERIKRHFEFSLAAPRPVHVLLEGPAGTAKSLFLAELGRLPHSRFAPMTNASRAGLITYLLADPDVRYLVLDELEKGDPKDRAALLTVMESGVVAELKHGRASAERRVVWVFAAANSTRKLERELLDRFLVEPLQPYSRGEMHQALYAVLVQREHVDPELAEELAGACAGRTSSPRAVVRIARMARGDRATALRLVDEIL